MAQDATILSTRKNGHDYPIGFVRWTEQRNFEAMLDLLAEQRVDRRAPYLAPLQDRRCA